MRRLLAFIVAPAFLLGGIWLGGHPEALPGPLRDGLVDDDGVSVVREALDDVQDRYYRELTDKELTDAAIAGIVSSLEDPFSAYFNATEYARFKEAQEGAFSGVGMSVVTHPRGLRVVQVFDGSPAKRSGIEVGDVIVQADGKDLKGRGQDTSVALIKGPSGSRVTLELIKDGKRVTKRVTRATISVPVVETRMRNVDDTKLGQVALAEFSSGAHADLYAGVKRVLDKGAKGIVLDLRGNGGGLVDEAQLVASAFLRDGKIVTTRGRSVPERTLSATGNPVAPKVPLVVLVDNTTASAAEIVAGALQDRGRAKLVGQRTFGKGVFQQVLELDNGGALDITAGQYFLPSGRNVGGKGTKLGVGLAPDVVVKDDPKTRADEQLRRALREVLDEVDG